MTASASTSTSSSASTASAFSIFAITWAVDPSCSIRALRSRTSAADRTKDSAMKSHPSLSANSRSWRSFRVSDGIGIGTPGRFTPLWDVTVPPTTMPHRNRPDSTASTRSRIIPSSINTSCPGRKTSPMAAGATGSSPLPAPSPPVTTVTSEPCVRTSGWSSPPTRNFGPCRSPISASGRPTFSWTSRMSFALAA